ncbi:hypothetical protein [Bacillus safensis]|uniref:hypothetical protein n=1 Tax=Bacillus safensis TaxID=561879 RepID=UPI000BF33A09|nr:hypothetical protein [Bacillus safensis]PGC67580.1 hypothetical protein COL97_01420 [Bacillus safensis]
MKRTIPVPQRVYKFMEPQFLKKVKLEKKIYINFLGNYSTDKHGNAIGDDDEGKLNMEIHLNSHTLGFEDNSELDHFLHNNVVSMKGAETKVQFSNVKIEGHNIDNNYYNYCVAMKYSERVKQEFGGAMMVINDFPRFIEEVNKKLAKLKIGFVEAKQCEYIVNRKKLYTEDNFEYQIPSLIKDKDNYEYQQEFRLLWKPISGLEITKPINLYCPNALEYCTFHF